ncbi:arsenate reductase/protein-tyrosine-phosphatase family protein [Auraticoccus monumenti]|uniref:Protein-tyrosine phosphatase n=1 Tax=Auraticoccus monumenti TaxID=675864 RepID=A0A1G6VTZ8_9ACTN|nr:hypothetical protein [Auraticoccus monumenti]SDD57039.1 protein-tyrosine phosphatase [Auraticoccus monumenti]
MDVLVVCTGNVCRSPATQLMMRHGVDGLPGLPPGVLISSAGTAALVGEGIAPATAQALRRLDVPLDDHWARQLDAGMVERADLVLTASRRHRSVVAHLVPQAIDKTFTLREFARYCGTRSGSVVGDLGEMTGFAISQRGLVLPQRPEDDDLPDPWGRSGRTHRRVAGYLRDAVVTVLDAVSPAARRVR